MRMPEQAQTETDIMPELAWSFRELVSELVSTGAIEPGQEQMLADGDRGGPASHGQLLRLVETGALSGEQLAAELGRISGLDVIAEMRAPGLSLAEGMLSRVFMRENRIVACRRAPAAGSQPGGGEILLIATNPFDREPLRSAAKAVGRAHKLVLTPIEEMDSFLSENLRGEQARSAARPKTSEQGAIDLLIDMARGAPVVTEVNQILEQAVDSRATDIHAEPGEHALRIRYRVDGVLRDAREVPIDMAAAVLSRIKVLGRMDIAERRKPQDGAARLTVHGADLDLRIATLPTSHGESAVIRLLNRNAKLATLETMGIEGRNLSAIQRLLDHPFGMIAVTGPTGSGKTTTLAAAISRLNDNSRKIVTIEDPIEYRIPNVSQTQVRPEIGLNFASAIRAFVRQDPDIIMVGEIRDSETAKTAVQAAQTGHLLLSTLHANTAVAAITRLRDLGVESYLLASNLRGVLAQRLVRVLCPSCKEEHRLEDREIRSDHRHSVLGFREGDRVYRAVGCSKCAGSGYRGRVPVFEVFEIDRDIAFAISNERPELELLDMARSKGMTTLGEDARRLADEGTTSPAEIFRVTAYL